MPNKTGFKASLVLGGTSVTTRRSVEFRAAHNTIDVSDLGDWIANKAQGIMSLDANVEKAYKNQSGRNWTMTIGAGYTGAELEGGSISWTNTETETADAADYITQRVADVADVRLTATARYNATSHFQSMLWTAASSNVSLAFTVVDANASTVFGGTCRVALGSIRQATRAAVGQSFEADVIGVTTVGVSAQLLRWAKNAISGAATKAVKITDPAGTVKLSGTGQVMAATLTWGRDATVVETAKIGMYALTSMP